MAGEGLFRLNLTLGRTDTLAKTETWYMIMTLSY